MITTIIALKIMIIINRDNSLIKNGDARYRNKVIYNQLVEIAMIMEMDTRDINMIIIILTTMDTAIEMIWTDSIYLTAHNVIITSTITIKTIEFPIFLLLIENSNPRVIIQLIN